MGVALVHRALENRDRFVGSAEGRIGAGDVVENTRVIGVYGNGAIDEIKGFFRIADCRHRDRTHDQSAGIIGVELEPFVHELYRAPVGILGVNVLARRLVCLTKQEPAPGNPRGEEPTPAGSFAASAGCPVKTRTRKEIRRLEQLRVEAQRCLELALGFVVFLAQRNREPARNVRFREIRLELESFAARQLCLAKVELAGIEVHVEQRAAVGHAGMRQRILGIDLDRLVEHLLRVLEALAAQLVENWRPRM